MNTSPTHAKPSAQVDLHPAQVYLHPAIVLNRLAVQRLQMRHQVIFRIQGKRVVAVPANDLPGGGDAA